jgi:hypothetical protein
MSNYTKNVNYTAKDALTVGDPAKKIRGSEMDAELDEIATAIATKEDLANKGTASGYASLDSSSLVPVAQLPAATTAAQGAVELATSAEAITGTDTTRAVTPDALSDTISAVLANGIGLLSDFYGMADPNADRILFWDDSAGVGQFLTLGTNLAITGTTLDATSTATTDASLLTSGTLPDARIQASGVTQHQASLSIAETQIADGAILGRLAASETATGQWNFSNGAYSGGSSIGWRDVLRSTTTTTAVVADAGKCIAVSAGITIPNATFTAGMAVSIYNDSASSITITQGASLTLRWAGSTSTGNRTLAARGLATIWFNTTSEGVISGSGLT